MSSEMDPSNRKAKLTWRDRLNVFGLFRFLFGQTRDSNGKPNNVLMLFYLSVIVTSVALLGSVFYKTSTYRIDLVCLTHTEKTSKAPTKDAKPKPKPVPTSDTKKPLKSIPRRSRRKRKVSRLLSNKHSREQKRMLLIPCGKATVHLQATLQPAPPLPSTFYWVVFGFVVFLGMLYMGRHTQTREWSVDLLYAWKGGPRRREDDDDSSGGSNSSDGSLSHTGKVVDEGDETRSRFMPSQDEEGR